MRLRDRALGRGIKAKKQNAADPKPYPLESGDWSSCDESDEDSAWDPVVAAMGFVCIVVHMGTWGERTVTLHVTVTL